MMNVLENPAVLVVVFVVCGVVAVVVTANVVQRREWEKTKAALRAIEARYRPLFENAPVGYHELDVNGRITKVNVTELAMLGRTEDEVVGHFPWEFVVEEQLSRMAVELKMSGRVPLVPVERTYLKKNGERIPVLISDVLLKDEYDKVTGIRSTLQDISQLKLVEREREKAISELQSALAHMKMLSGLLQICTRCKRIHSESGTWDQLEAYLQEHSEATFTESICPTCQHETRSGLQR
jgi:PAS domain S-box-containing protein